MREQVLDQEHNSIQIMAKNLPQGQRPTTHFRDSPDAFTVRRLFVFIKEHLEFEYLEDEFIKRNFFPDRNSREYVFNAPDYYRCERFLKLLIRKGRCKEFIECMHDMKCNNDVVYGTIRNFQNFGARTAWQGFPDITGCVDITMIKIVPPSENEADIYAVKAFMRSIYRVLDVIAKLPGSVHGAQSFMESNLFTFIEEGLWKFYI